MNDSIWNWSVRISSNCSSYHFWYIFLYVTVAALIIKRLVHFVSGSAHHSFYIMKHNKTCGNSYAVFLCLPVQKQELLTQVWLIWLPLIYFPNTLRILLQLNQELYAPLQLVLLSTKKL